MTAVNQVPSAPQPSNLQEEELVVGWQSMNRVFKKRSREYYTSIATIAFLVSVLLFFFNLYMLIFVIIALAFASYALALVPPEMAEHIVTSYGLYTSDRFYSWSEMERFWFSNRLGHRLLSVELKGKLVRRVTVLLGEVPEDDLRAIFQQFLPEHRPLQTVFEKMVDWFETHFPMDAKE